ncbi:MAG: nicotinate-nucleotide adenylyltransferase [Candidatus Eisenbacteria bacterium]|uniref:Nicotinate-nucleotide adenylyltransferase n=1 Tax=Eiseniibacteriota bacterium TaxID=2212470 RepID=A0A938BRV2_UNCEI|nr:nicotinate-nucleotide adenylyltransferase [Candidatus Eisenbacteria bacterium]
MAARGVIHGRFQVLHNDHLVYLLAGRALCRHLVVGITNPDPGPRRDEPADPDPRRDEPADPDRGSPLANPLTYFERHQLVRAATEEAGVPPGDLSIVPFPIHDPASYAHYLPLDALFFLTIYDAWGREKLARFRALGLRTRVLWERPEEAKGIRGRVVRERMARGEPWQALVPPSVARLLEAWGVPERIRALHARGGEAPG